MGTMSDSLRRSRRFRFALAGIGLLVGVGVAAATSGFEREPLLDPDEGYEYRIEHSLSNSGNDGPPTILRVTRGAINSSTEEFSLAARVEVQGAGILTALQLQVADDANSNGIVESGEWTTVATGSITTVDGWSIGETTAVTRTLADDGWRIRMTRTDLGVCFEEVIDAGLEWSD